MPVTPLANTHRIDTMPTGFDSSKLIGAPPDLVMPEPPSGVTQPTPTDVELTNIPGQLRVRGPDGQPRAVSFRKATAWESRNLLKCDERDEFAEETRRHWAENPAAYYRWKLEGGEVGLINDLARHAFMALMMTNGNERTAPLATACVIDGRVAGFMQSSGDPILHVDSAMRTGGYQGIGTAMLARFLAECHELGMSAQLTAVNGSYPFYAKLGFEYSSPSHTPDHVTEPANERFDMHVDHERIPELLNRIAAKDRDRHG